MRQELCSSTTTYENTNNTVSQSQYQAKMNGFFNYKKPSSQTTQTDNFRNKHRLNYSAKQLYSPKDIQQVSKQNQKLKFERMSLFKRNCQLVNEIHQLRKIQKQKFCHQSQCKNQNYQTDFNITLNHNFVGNFTQQKQFHPNRAIQIQYNDDFYEIPGFKLKKQSSENFTAYCKKQQNPQSNSLNNKSNISELLPIKSFKKKNSNHQAQKFFSRLRNQSINKNNDQQCVETQATLQDFQVSPLNLFSINQDKNIFKQPSEEKQKSVGQLHTLKDLNSKLEEIRFQTQLTSPNDSFCNKEIQKLQNIDKYKKIIVNLPQSNQQNMNVTNLKKDNLNELIKLCSQKRIKVLQNKIKKIRNENYMLKVKFQY